MDRPGTCRGALVLLYPPWAQRSSAGTAASTIVWSKVWGTRYSAWIPRPAVTAMFTPLPAIFASFLSLILAAGHTNPLQQIICWDKETFEAFLRRPEERAQTARPEVQLILTSIRQKLGVAPATDPFGAVKNLQSGFPYDQIPFSNEYYDMLGVASPQRERAGRAPAFHSPPLNSGSKKNSAMLFRPTENSWGPRLRRRTAGAFFAAAPAISF